MDARKRWMTVARREGGGWYIEAPEPVGDLASWTQRLHDRAGPGAVALGVDFPLGLPRAYARLYTDSVDFPDFLTRLANRPAFFQVCAGLNEISADRPFYPVRGIAGMTRAAHAARLGLNGPADLSRACDQSTASRPAGAPLFWTLGANQTGKAAITAWRDWLLPAFAGPRPPKLWPFHGGLHELLTPGALVIAETYPAEAMRQIGVRMTGSKRRQSDRKAVAAAILLALERVGAITDPALAHTLDDGFGADPSGEDRFDSVLGLLCLIGVLDFHRPDSIPDDPWIRRWEGWVLGQSDLPKSLQPE